MALPVGLQTVTVTFGPYLAPDGTPAAGTVTFQPHARRAHTPSGAVLSDGQVTVRLDAGGAGQVVLPASDAADTNPTSVRYTVFWRLVGMPERAPEPVFLPASSPTADLDQLVEVTDSGGRPVAVPVLPALPATDAEREQYIPARLADTALRGVFAPLSVRRIARLNRAARPYGISNPVVHPAPPTITESTTQTITTNFRAIKGDDLNSLTAISGGTPVLNTGTGFVTNPVNAPSATDSHVGFILIGDTFEYRWRNSYTASAPAPQFEILVDGMPTVAGNVYTTTLTTSAPNQYFLKAVFPDSRPREVRIYGRASQFMEIRIPNTQSVARCAKRPWTIGWIADSYGDENATAGTPSGFQVFPRRVCRALGAEFLQSTQPGSGYTVGGASSATFVDSRRITALAAASPDLIVVVGGTNDWNSGSPNLSAVSTAVTSMLTQIAAAMPGVPVIVAGPQALNHTQTLAAAYATLNQTIRTAALAQPNVLAHVDMIGNAATGTVPSAYASGAAYAVGQQMTYQGAIYACTNTIASGGGTPDMNYWSLQSWLTGTGNTGSLANNGDRDAFLHSDGTHPTLAGQDNLVARITGAILNALATGAIGA